MEATRLRALERDVREMATSLAVKWVWTQAVKNREMEPALVEDARQHYERMRAIALRLAEPCGEDAPISSGRRPTVAELEEILRQPEGKYKIETKPDGSIHAVEAAPTDEPSESDLRAFGLEINRIESWPPHYRARFAWRWCRARMAAAPSPATVEEIAGIIRARNHAGNNRQLLWLDPEHVAREIAARIPAPAVPAEIVRDLPLTARGEWANWSAAHCRAVDDLIAWARTQPAPAPDPRAAGEQGV